MNSPTNNALDTEKMSTALQFTLEDDISYFCKHDEIIGLYEELKNVTHKTAQTPTENNTKE